MTATGFWMLIKLSEAKIFTGWTVPRPWTKISMTQLLMHNLFVVANLPVALFCFTLWCNDTFKVEWEVWYTRV